MQIELSDAAYRAISEALIHARVAHALEVERYTSLGHTISAKHEAEREQQAQAAWEILLSARYPSTLGVR
jgi:hypothetical protein